MNEAKLRTLIRQELEEGFDDKLYQPIIGSSIDSEDVLEVGKNYFKNIRKVNDVFSISKNVKGYHKENVIKSEITRKKIEQVIEYAQRHGAINVKHSVMTKSVYFQVNGIDFRISDHRKNNFLGIDVLVKWNSNMDEMLYLVSNKIDDVKNSVV